MVVSNSIKVFFIGCRVTYPKHVAFATLGSMNTTDLGHPKLVAIEGDRESLEREALAALIFDEPRYRELKQRLFEQPRPRLRVIESCACADSIEPVVLIP